MHVCARGNCISRNRGNGAPLGFRSKHLHGRLVRLAGRLRVIGDEGAEVLGVDHAPGGVGVVDHDQAGGVRLARAAVTAAPRPCRRAAGRVATPITSARYADTPSAEAESMASGAAADWTIARENNPRASGDAMSSATLIAPAE